MEDKGLNIILYDFVNIIKTFGEKKFEKKYNENIRKNQNFNRKKFII